MTPVRKLVINFLRYFIGIPPDSPSHRHLYSVPSEPLSSPAVPNCLTCSLAHRDIEGCAPSLYLQ